MVLIDRSHALELERFEYSRVGATWGVARLTLAVDAAAAPLAHVQLAVARAGQTSRLEPAGACRTELRLGARGEGSDGQLLWRGVFALPHDLLEDPSATFVLHVDGDRVMALAAPLARSGSLPALVLRPARERSSTSRAARVTAATTAATLAAGMSFTAVASAKATKPAANVTGPSSSSSAPASAGSASAQAAAGSASTSSNGSPAAGSASSQAAAPPAPAGSAPAPTANRSGSTGAASTHSGASASASASSSTHPAAATGWAGVGRSQSTGSSQKPRTPAHRSRSTRPGFDVHHVHLASPGAHHAAHHRRHPILAGSAPVTLIGGHPDAKRTPSKKAAAEKTAAQREAAKRKAAEQKAAEQRAARRAAARQFAAAAAATRERAAAAAAARRRAAIATAARRAELRHEAASRRAHRRHERAAERRAVAVERHAISARIQAAALHAAARHVSSSTAAVPGGVSFTPLPGFRGPSSWTGVVASNPALSGTLGNLSGLLSDADRPPSFLIPLYMEAARRYHVPWQVLAAINSVESDYGRDLSTSSAGAIGWMQFEPATWKEYGVAADGVSEPNPYDPRDAIFAAARYLHANGAAESIRGAIFAYNHAGWYVDEVMSRAGAIAAHAQYERASVSRRGDVSVDFATTLRTRPLVRYSGGVLSHFDRLIAAANMVSAADFPYRWGGGHEQPSHFGPFDCSGSVSYVMQQAGYRLPTTVAADVGGWHLPAGPGRVTIFYDAVHTFMRIGNRFFGTSGFARPGGGAGWFDVGRLPVGYLAAFHEVHVPRLGADSFSSTAVLPLGPAALTLRHREIRARARVRAQERAELAGLQEARLRTTAARELTLSEMVGWLVAHGEHMLRLTSPS